VSIRTFLTALSKLRFRKPPPSLEEAQQLYTLGRQAEAVALFRSFADAGSMAARIAARVVMRI
jgi:hypothetical protein